MHDSSSARRSARGGLLGSLLGSLLFAALLLLSCLAGSAGAAAAASPKAFCAPMLPARAPLPTGIGLPGLAIDPTLLVTANALEHHVLCRVGVYSPSDNARYNVNWYVFPTHTLAVSDYNDLDLSEIYVSVHSRQAAPGFPSPAALIEGTFLFHGSVESIITVSFVDGPTLASASMLGGGSVAQAEALARWTERDIARIAAKA